MSVEASPVLWDSHSALLAWHLRGLCQPVVQPAPQMSAPGPACVDSGVCPAPFLARGGAGWLATWHCLRVFLPSLGHGWFPPAEPRQLGLALGCGSEEGTLGRSSWL